MIKELFNSGKLYGYVTDFNGGGKGIVFGSVMKLGQSTISASTTDIIALRFIK